MAAESSGTNFSAVATATLLLVSCAPAADGPPAPEPTPSPFQFTEVAAVAGLDFVHRNGAAGAFYYPELMQGGGAFADFDNDGWLDVYLVQSGPLPASGESPEAANRLYRGGVPGADGRQSFVEVPEAGGAGDRGYGSGVAIADYDRDGLVDVYVTNLGSNRLYRNTGVDDEGNPTFENVTPTAGVGDPGYSTSAAFLDYDADGDLDLYVCNYVNWSPGVERPCLGFNGQRGYCSPLEYEPQSDTLYRNDGGSRFTDVSRETGIAGVAGNGLGVVTADFDGDGLVDIYVANDQMPNHLWINQGRGPEGRVGFREEALQRGAALNELGRAEAGMGVAVEDPDLDGDWDLFMVHISTETNTFYRNENGDFRDLTDELGLGAAAQPYTGFGTGFADFDNDGVLDIFIANGKVRLGDDVEFDYREPNMIFEALDDGGYRDVSAGSGEALELEEVSRASAFGDYDNDGDVDILVVNNEGPVRLLRNDSPTGHWLEVELRDASLDRDAIGAVVRVEAGGRSAQRQIQPAYGYCSGNDPRAHFGLGDSDRVDRVTVRWPDGSTTTLDDVAADRILRVERQPPGADRDKG